MKDKLTVLLPINKVVDENFFSQTILPIADEQAISFIHTVSQLILTKSSFRAYPELMAMSFWMRKAHILEIINENLMQEKLAIRLARGVVFHIAPSNVDSIFIYSWFLSMLSGNINVIRLSSKTSKQIELLLSLLNELFVSTEYEEIARRQIIVTYSHDQEVTSYLSKCCDMRVIWGGDNTINNIRKIPIKPTAIELPFTNKFSLSLINALEFLALNKEGKAKLIKSFINDAYWFGQMACSSPRLIVWIGGIEIIDKAKKIFWQEAYNYLGQDFSDISVADIVNKLVASQSMAIEAEAIIIKPENNFINRIELSTVKDINTDLHCGAGMFYELSIIKIEELIPILSRKIQTVGYFGVSESLLRKFVQDYSPKGIDRFVPIGKALEFSPVWDGYNLLCEFTRVIKIQ